MSGRLARWVDHHWWVPFLFGTDGLTGRERRRMANRYMATLGNPYPRAVRDSEGNTE